MPFWLLGSQKKRQRCRVGLRITLEIKVNIQLCSDTIERCVPIPGDGNDRRRRKKGERRLYTDTLPLAIGHS